MIPTKILVVGATGQQGGGVVNALLSLGSTDLTITALTRNPTLAAAQKLSSKGVGLCKGDLLDRESLVAALADVDAAYLVTDFRGPEGVSGELQQGRQFVECAREAGVKHLVFSSVAGADIAKPVEHFYTKYHLEEYIRESGLGWTIIRPVGFMEVIPPPGIGRLLFLSAIATLMGNTQQRYVACDDIGKAVATTLIRPEKYVGKTVTICGQVATVDELEASLEKGEAQKGWGRIWMPRWLVIRMTPYHYGHMFDASCQVSQYLPWGGLADAEQWLYYDNCQPGSVEETREMIGDVMDIETWARGQQADTP